jgi:hypothetical protein
MTASRNFRIPALQYRGLVEALKGSGTEVNDKAKGFAVQPFEKTGQREPLKHQAEALAAWIRGNRRGTVELPTVRAKRTWRRWPCALPPGTR